MEIRRYRPEDEAAIYDMMRREDDQWDYYDNPEYGRALLESATYVAYEEGVLCGFSRSYDDFGMYIFVLDLLVDKRYRNRGIGQRLMEVLLDDFHGQPVFVLSDVDGFYQRKGYTREGSVFEVVRHGKTVNP